MDILYNIGVALLMGIVAFSITRWAHTNNIKILQVQGRLNRLQFLIGLIGLTLISSLFDNLIALLTEKVVVLVAYWAIRFFAFTGHSILLSFFYVLYARRFQDMSIHGLFGILWCLFMAFTYPYTNIKSWNFFFLLIAWTVNGLLLFIPGKTTANPYGLPPNWPKSSSSKKSRSARTRRSERSMQG
ncbi:MAG: DUF805 domain-containing protein [Veillonella sp.]|uniref:DUF805 domain-containing protein n=1 Tax=Veillonella sp. TaxID=1926307 RepID=UPI0025D19BAE|nr:DUF805 domain-containing protein [Veillonella sp.]MBS4913535.1 DUF805 domain-containing protein [Veillonella sp.]